jgi:peptidyl-prolyl cis-trans isomerase SurA
MYRFLLLFLIAISTSFVFGQKDAETIMTIDGKAISKEEFVRLYKKNNTFLTSDAEKKTPKEYLELFVNFKLKAFEAEQLKYDTLPAFVNELKTYREELAKPYLTAVQYTNLMVEKAYERLQNEIKASHILLRVDGQASAEDTLKVWNSINKIRNELANGADFGEMALKYSEDPSAKANKGLLGYFTAFQMVYPFETAAYSTPVGEISKPVRTGFGYHLIRVEDIRPAKGQVKVAHVMKRVAENIGEDAIIKQKQEIDSLAKVLSQGADFGKLASAHSDDRQSAGKGGELSWFSPAGMMPEFAAPAFALENDGDISPVVRTPYGWHIIKRLGYKAPPAFIEVKDMLAEKIRQNPQISRHSNEIFINRLKEEYQFEQNEQLIHGLQDKAKQGQAIPTLNAVPQTVLFNFDGQQITAGQFAEYLQKEEKTERQNNPAPSFSQHYENFIAETLTKYEDAHLEEKHPDFKYLMKEYHDGILLFNISEDKIWNAAAKDSTGLQAFYDQTRKKHLWNGQFKGWAIKCTDQETRDFIDAIFEADPQIEAPELEDQLKVHFGAFEGEIDHGHFGEGQNPLVDYFVWNSAKPQDFVDGLHFIRGDKVGPAPKTLEEARGLYVSDYQNYLEEKWLGELRNKYPVKVNKKVLNSIEPVK